MTSPIRPFLSSLLCCVIVFGHAPAWLHVATCDGHSQPKTSVASEKTESACLHCCSHHFEDDASVTDQASVGDLDSLRVAGDSGTGHEHDSDDCLICQSLASPCGVAWQLSAPLATELVSQPALLSTDRCFASASLSIAHPRGPPALA